MSPLKRFLYLFLLLSFSFCSGKEKQAFTVLKRSSWNAVDSVISRNHSIQRITIHHGGEAFPADKHVPTYLKNLQSWSRREKKWSDVPYHWLIAPNGDIYEGRPDSISGDTNTSYNPTGHLLICALGNFEEIEIPKKQYDALVWFTRKMMTEHNIVADSIATHKDFTETLCPGKNLYRFFADGSFKRDIN